VDRLHFSPPHHHSPIVQIFDPSSLEESLSGSLKPFMVRVEFWFGVYGFRVEKKSAGFQRVDHVYLYTNCERLFDFLVSMRMNVRDTPWAQSFERVLLDSRATSQMPMTSSQRRVSFPGRPKRPP
jgi:hypothetical protein